MASKQDAQTLQTFSSESLTSKGIKDNGDLMAIIPGAAPLEQVG